MRPIAKKFPTGLLLAAITFLAVPAGSATGQTGAVKPPTKQESSDIRPLESGKEIERELAGGATHLYNINLAAAQFVRVVVEQRGIDVVAILIEPGGKKIVEMDSPNGTQGPETVTAIAEVAGNYRLEVRSLENNAEKGHYAVRIEELRASTEKDKVLEEAQRVNQQIAGLLGEGKYKEALPLAEQALKLLEKVLGVQHIQFSFMLNSIGVIQRDTGNYALAEASFLRALSILEKIPGVAPLEITAQYNNLAILYQRKGDFTRAESIYKRALEITEKAGFGEAPDTTTILIGLAGLYQEMSDYSRAETMYLRSRTILEKSIGTENDYFATLLNNIGVLYQAKGDYFRAEEILKTTLAIRLKVHSPDHPEYATSLNNLALLYQEMGDNLRAEELLMRWFN